MTADPYKNPDYYTYWYHPESSCAVAMTNAAVETYSFNEPLDEVDLKVFLETVDDGKYIPKDVKGILKNAKWADAPYPPETIVGDLWYNPQGQFPNGIRIYTSRITDLRSDGIYCSLHSKYFVQFAPGCEKRTRFV